MDQTLARAFSGLSFTYFQDAFQGWTEPSAALADAGATASQALRADQRDPSGHWAMGRALWLGGESATALDVLSATLKMSPGFVPARYMLAFINSQSGDPELAIRFADEARQLSPYDPLLFGFLGARAIALARLGQFGEASRWAQRAAICPNAHPHISTIAACCLHLDGQPGAATKWVSVVETRDPRYTAETLISAFRFEDDARDLFGAAARSLLKQGGSDCTV